MKKSYAIVANAIIWGIVIFASSVALKGTGSFQDIQLILAEGALFSLVIVGITKVQKNM
jgi:hypothetical protein